MEKEKIVKQTKLAFDFIQRLYLETSYFIKEVEGFLQREEEEFKILRPSGYGITTFRSIGLESGMQDWLIKKGAVFFAAKANTEVARGQTITKFVPDLKVIVVRFVLNDKGIDEPEVWAGVAYDISLKAEYHKFEALTWKFAYYDRKILRDAGKSTYEDGEITFKLDVIKKHLYSMSSSEDIQREIVQPVLDLYRKKGV